VIEGLVPCDICGVIQVILNNPPAVADRDATIYQYIVNRIVISPYRRIDTKLNRIDISCIVIYRCIVACYNDLKSNYCTLSDT